MARCLRCKAGNEWIEGDVKATPPDVVIAAAGRLLGSEPALAGTDPICDDAITLAQWVKRLAPKQFDIYGGSK